MVTFSRPFAAQRKSLKVKKYAGRYLAAGEMHLKK